MGDLERTARRDREPQHPDLTREREHHDGQRGQPEQRERQPDRQPALASSAPREAGAEPARAPPRAPPPARPKPSRRCPSHRSTRTARRFVRPRSRPPERRKRRPSAAHRPSRPSCDPAPTPTPITTSTAISAAHTAHATRASLTPYVPSAARAEAPPASFNPAAATSTSPRTRQTTTETIDGREGNSIRARLDASPAPSRPQESLRSRSSSASTAPGSRRTAASSGSSPCATRTARPSY